MQRLILASTSPRRKELVKKITKDFMVIPSNYEEVMDMSKSPEELVKELSKGKALDVAATNKGIILGVDTFVIFDTTYIGKPKSREEAKRVLQQLRGNMHSIITGFTIVDTNSQKVFSDTENTNLYFTHFSDKEIEEYLDTKEYMDKAGAYAIQEIPKNWIEKVEGGLDSAIGLPVEKIKKTLIEQFGFTF